MTLNPLLDKDEIFNEVNLRIANTTSEEDREIEREVAIEVEDTKRRIARMEKGEYF